jgi:rfaE bifunctional protein nucleotidyltransferase chain/domain
MAEPATEVRQRFVSALPEGMEARLRDAGVALDQVAEAAVAIEASFRRGGKLLIFGNGGSAADAQHMAAEFVGRFLLDRRALPALALTTDSSAITAIGNDVGFDQVFARQVEAFVKAEDVALAISTSGASPNVIAGVRAVHAAGGRSIALVGPGGSLLEQTAEIPIVIPGPQTARIQETQLVVEHALCGSVEAMLFGPDAEARLGDGEPLCGEGKVLDWDELLEQRARWRRENRRVVWTNGCFDLLHIGHVKSLRAARRLGDVLVVGVNGDESVRRLKGRGRPFVPVSQRMEVLAALEAVDYVVVLEDTRPDAALARLQPDVHCKGADYSESDLPELDAIREYGGTIEFVPFITGVSTTKLVRRMAAAREMRDDQRT